MLVMFRQRKQRNATKGNENADYRALCRIYRLRILEDLYRLPAHLLRTVTVDPVLTILTLGRLTMAMARKQFVAIATEVADVRAIADGTGSPEALAAVDLLAERLASVCAGENGRFDRDRFLRACGLER